MRYQEFETEQWLPFPRPLVFAFFANPKNLPPLMPHWQAARVDEVTFCPPPPRPDGTSAYPGVAAGSGTKLLITARAVPLVPLRGKWLASIEEFRWNESFCDIQLQGPFASWKHCHSVHDTASPETGALGTVVRDHVTYALPLQPVSRLGFPVSQLSMAALFRYRQMQATRLVSRFAEQVGSKSGG